MSDVLSDVMGDVTGDAISAISPILVVGAGPVGLTMAAELARHGLPCRIIEVLEGPSIWSKAAVVNSRTLEVFADMGIVDEAISRGRPMHRLNMFSHGRGFAHLELGGMETPYPYLLGLSQRETELLLERHVQRLGLSVERKVQLEAVIQDPEGVTARLRHPDGREEHVRTRWLVGCDGAHSTVRRDLNLPFEGSTYEQSIIQADVRIDWPTTMPDDEGIGFLSNDGPLGALPLLSEGRYRLLAMLDPGQTLEPTLETFQMLMDRRGMPGARVHSPAWMVAFRFHCRMVPRYRVGRIFLAGDAAHIHSPAGGQGMNMGIQDAYNLAWKLALVARGVGTPALLESYDPERRPVAASVLRGTDIATRSAFTVAGLANRVAIEMRDQFASFVTGLELFQDRASEALGGLETHYSDSPILKEHRVPLLLTRVRHDDASEEPAVKDWLEFKQGPGLGSRAPDVALAVPVGPSKRLLELLRGITHTLLMFDGAAPTDAGYQAMDELAERIRERHGDWIRVFMILPSDRRTPMLSADDAVILDADQAIHRRYGASSECMYLIRPDGYVGFRSMPADREVLLEYLESIFM